MELRSKGYQGYCVSQGIRPVAVYQPAVFFPLGPLPGIRCGSRRQHRPILPQLARRLGRGKRQPYRRMAQGVAITGGGAGHRAVPIAMTSEQAAPARAGKGHHGDGGSLRGGQYCCIGPAMRHIVAVHQHFDPPAGDQLEREQAVVGCDTDVADQPVVLPALQFVERAIGGEQGVDIVVRRDVFEIKNIERGGAQSAQGFVAIGAQPLRITRLAAGGDKHLVAAIAAKDGKPVQHRSAVAAVEEEIIQSRRKGGIDAAPFQPRSTSQAQRRNGLSRTGGQFHSCKSPAAQTSSHTTRSSYLIHFPSFLPST